MNAFNKALGFVGKAADGLLTGGQIGAANRRNQFADLMAAGNYNEAAMLAARNNAPQYANLAAAQMAEQQKAQEAARQQENQLFSGLAIGLSQITDANARAMAFEAMKPGLAQRYGLDEEDFAQVPIQDGNALRLFGQQLISPETQVNQQLTAQKQAEDARSARVGEGLRSREIGIAQQNADTNRMKAQQGPMGGTITLPDGTVIQTGPTQQESARRRVESRGQRVQLISDKFDEALGQVNRFSAGPGSITAGFPGSPARDLAATMDTIRANIGFEELNAMREASKTGGALGQVTEREIAFLQAVLGNLEQSQSPEQLKKNLGRAKREVANSWQRVMDAYEDDYGQEYSGPGSLVGEDNADGLTPQEQQELEALRRELGVAQ